MIKHMKRVFSFLKYNSHKRLFIKVLVLTAFYRLCMLIIPMKSLKKRLGKLNEESALEESAESVRQASKVAYVVNHVSEKTPWQSKCFVRALTTQHLLKKKKIPSTLYLGVANVGDEMKAHAWLRSGRYYLTGGNGEGYAVVAKFYA